MNNECLNRVIKIGAIAVVVSALIKGKKAISENKRLCELEALRKMKYDI